MNIGFYFECNKRSGGVYQYALNLLDGLKELSDHQFTVFNISQDFPFEDYNLPNWKVVNLINVSKDAGTESNNGNHKKMPLRRKLNLFMLGIIRKFKLYDLEIFLERINSQKRAGNFLGRNLDLMFFHGPSELSFLTNIPSVVPIHDLHHRSYPNFPEMSKFGRWEKSEYLFKHIKDSAYKIIVDSQVGKEDVIKFYNVKPEKIIICPPLGPSYLNNDNTEQEKQEMRDRYKLPLKFIFYPAQLWPHKNHINLIKAIKILSDKGIDISLVLSGARQDIWGEYDRIVAAISELGLENKIYVLGYVNNQEISLLYSMSSALVMPTFVGWTHIPIAEAWFMQCPVVYSTARGCMEQGGNAALYPDPSKPEDIADKITKLLKDETLRKRLIESGNKKLAAWTKQDVATLIKDIVNNFQNEKNKK